MLEYVQTIPTFWDTVVEFTKENPQYIAQNNAIGFLSDDAGTSYNLCHCKCRLYFLASCSTDDPAVWSNFEIADMDLWRGEAYTKYFDYLEASGGFYYEVSLLPCLSGHQLSSGSFIQRWGDAVVHTVAVGLFQSKDQIHFFKDIGYQHDFFSHCPGGSDWTKGRCSCNPKENFGKHPPCSIMIVPLTQIIRTPPARLHSFLMPRQVANCEQLSLMATLSSMVTPGMYAWKVWAWRESERRHPHRDFRAHNRDNRIILSGTCGIRYHYLLIYSFASPATACN